MFEKNIFVSFALIIALGSLFCFYFSEHKKFRVSKYISRVHLIAFILITTYSFSLFTENKTIATILISSYYSGINWFFLAFFDFLFVFAETPLTTPFTQIVRSNFKILAIADSLLLMSTFYTEFAFSLSKYYIEDVFIGWKEVHNAGYLIHSIFAYTIAVSMAIFLIKKIVDTPKIYRRKIVTMFICFIILMISNSFFVIIGGIFRFSILFYSFLAIFVSYITFFILPKEIEIKIKSLIVEDMKNAVAFFDLNGNCIFMNKFATEIFKTKENCHRKYEEYNILGSDFINMREEFKINGTSHILDIVSHRLRDKSNKKLGTYMTFNDVTEEYNKLETEKYRSTHDLLTGFYNRSAFFKKAESVIRKSPHIKRCLICTNIKNFKLANDLFGTKFGDEILKNQALSLTEEQKYDETCVLGRISGDKFALLIKAECFDKDRLIKKTLSIQNYLNEVKYKLPIFIGVYEITDSYENIFSMYDKAYLAIKNKADNYEQILLFYDKSLMEKLIFEKQLIRLFDTAIEEKQFKMYLQPQVSSLTQKTVGAEALVRWENSEKGLIPPGDFIPALEKNGLIYLLDKYIWEEATKQLSIWQKQGIDLYIAVNISAKDFYYLDLYNVFTELVKKYDISPKKLKLEITETVLMHDISIHSKILTKLQEFGFYIEMDDFGSGYSSLNLLKNIKMDVLKIDMAFLKKTNNLEKSQAIIESVIKMAKELGMTIITEGIEEQSHIDFLTKCGCDIFQGYFFSKPISITDFEKKFIDKAE